MQDLLAHKKTRFELRVGWMGEYSSFMARNVEHQTDHSHLGSSDTRVLIAYEPETSRSAVTEGGVLDGNLFHLRNPRSGSAACYMILNGALQEVHWFKQRYTSWFLGNSVCEDGSLYLATSFDPLFMVLPVLEAARMKKGDDLGKFRALDEMMCVDDYPGYKRLMPLLMNSIHVICEVREVGASKYYRLDDSKVIGWLLCKVRRITEHLRLTQKSFSGMSEEDLNSYVVGLLSEYLPAEPWLSRLCSCLSVERGSSKTEQWVTPPEVLGVASIQATKQSESSLSKAKSAKKGAPQGVRKITSFFARPR
ncbi:hypothetical protein R1flu_007758 [Riccia fluitans]|uniref:Ribonuclease H2 subunit B n=1 Tax=Riccia fluitans TaxID=41844 RepID=A0ABD1Z2E7_9MARC